ncbi:MAG: ChaN family lipoprotein [Bacteroidota bacterium]
MLAASAGAQPTPAEALPPGAFQVYTADGAPASLDSLVSAMAAAEVVLLGETHDDAVAHVLQLDLLQRAHAAYAAARPLALSLEMFERDVQLVLDEYLAGLITESTFLGASRPWSNYETDYRPMVEWARAHSLPVVAANAPRRYVNRVSRLGAASLADVPAAAQAYLPPLPYGGASAAYEAKWNAIMREMAAAHGHSPAEDDTTVTPDPVEAADTTAAAPPPIMPDGNTMLQAQSLWDASMGYAVVEHLMKQPAALVLHVTGSFHVERGLGTPEQIARYRPGTRRLIVVFRPAADATQFNEADHAGLGDFVVLTQAPTAGR